MQALQEPLLQQSCVLPLMARATEIVAAWSVEDGVRSAGSGEDGGGGCGEGGVVGLIQNNDRTEKRISQSRSPMNHTEIPFKQRWGSN